MTWDTANFEDMGSRITALILPKERHPEGHESIDDVLKEYGFTKRDWDRVSSILVALGYNRCGWVVFTKDGLKC